MEFIQQVAAGATAGALGAFAGAKKNAATKQEEFSLRKFFDGVITGAIVGAVGGLVGARTDTIKEFGQVVFMYGGAAQILSHGYKYVKARLQ